MAKKKSKSFIGIDVSKQQLEVAAYESDYQFRGPNKASAFGELIAELISLRPALIVLEATGGLEIPVVSALHAAGLPMVVVNPRQVRDFAKALGQLAKTDRKVRILAAGRPFPGQEHSFGRSVGVANRSPTAIDLNPSGIGRHIESLQYRKHNPLPHSTYHVIAMKLI